MELQMNQALAMARIYEYMHAHTMFLKECLSRQSYDGNFATLFLKLSPMLRFFIFSLAQMMFGVRRENLCRSEVFLLGGLTATPINS